MSEDEKALRILENQIPAASGQAFQEARRQTLAAGHSVLQSEAGVIYEVFPDGTRVERKRIAAPTPVAIGSRIQLRRR